MEKEKRINNYKVKRLEYNNNKLNIDVNFDLVHKTTFKILDRVLTQNEINIQYNSNIDEYPRINITTLKGPTIHGFNLKRKHLEEIKKLLDDSNNEGLKKLKEKL